MLADMKQEIADMRQAYKGEIDDMRQAQKAIEEKAKEQERSADRSTQRHEPYSYYIDCVLLPLQVAPLLR